MFLLSPACHRPQTEATRWGHSHWDLYTMRNSIKTHIKGILRLGYQKHKKIRKKDSKIDMLIAKHAKRVGKS